MINKFLFHRILALFTLFCVSLTACTSVPVLTVTPTVSITPTIGTSTPTATETPTTVPTPTEIPVGALNPSHPEAGPRPEGETVYFDTKTNEWAKPNPENPEKPYYQKFITDLNTGEVLKQDWFTSIGEIPSLMEEMGWNYKLPVNFWCSESVSKACPTIYHEPSQNVITHTDSFSRQVYVKLLQRNGNKFTNATDAAFRSDLDAGNVVLEYATPRGMFEFTVNAKNSPQRSVNVFVVDESTFDKTTPDFSWKFLKWITIGDKNGDANIILSTQNKKKSMDSMTTDDFRDLVMFPVAQFIVLKGQDTQAFMEYSGPGIGDIMNWSTEVFNGYGPFLEITYPAR